MPKEDNVITKKGQALPDLLTFTCKLINKKQ